MRHPVAEGRLSTIDIPKGTSDLGIGISWCEDQVRQISTINVQYIYARVSVTLNSDECAMSRLVMPLALAIIVMLNLFLGGGFN